jgi:hypothetical protein
MMRAQNVDGLKRWWSILIQYLLQFLLEMDALRPRKGEGVRNLRITSTACSEFQNTLYTLNLLYLDLPD